MGNQFVFRIVAVLSILNDDLKLLKGPYLYQLITYMIHVGVVF